MLVLAGLCLGLGLFLPAIAASKWFILADRISLFETIMRLMRGPEWFLGAVILLFSALLPAAKILYLLKLAYWDSAEGEIARRAIAFIDKIGKWSMLDVFVVALAIVIFKTGTGANALVLPGVYLFFASVVLTSLASARILTRLKGRGKPL